MRGDTIVVIGAGVAGCLTVLKLAKDYKVLLIEAGSSVLPQASSSHNQCYKLHTGAHFIGDLATARHCLAQSVGFAREFPDVLAGDNLLSPWRRGRHYIVSNSLVSVERAKEVILQLQADYTQLVAEDEKNKVFGASENFIKFLTKADYPYLAETIPFYNSENVKTDIHVALGIETAESQVDIDKLQAYLQQQILTNQNITFMPLQEVTHMARNPLTLGYLVTSKNKAGEEQTVKARAVVNCAWQNIESLNKTLGLFEADDERVVRIKVSVLVQLPKALEKMNTCIFSSGPYASITVLPNGSAVLTSERTTNAGFFKAGVPIPEPIKVLLANMTLETLEGQEVARKILFECASYLSEDVRDSFLAAPIKELRVGFVKVIGNYTQQSIYQANSTIHARLDDGVEELEAGCIANAAMKMTYAASNATRVSEILPQHLAFLDRMDRFIVRIKDRLYHLHAYLKPMSRAIDQFIYINYRSLIEEKVSASEFEQNFEQCVKDLVNTITFATYSLVVRRPNSNFTLHFQALVRDFIGNKFHNLSAQDPKPLTQSLSAARSFSSEFSSPPPSPCRPASCGPFFSRGRLSSNNGRRTPNNTVEDFDGDVFLGRP